VGVHPLHAPRIGRSDSSFQSFQILL
jgi:hypothetical protein